ncbi:type II secretion system protein F [bacterium BMS3Bbin06]|nr:type II secretion system protein F [bacterium BMS3Abin08]GBE34889.1 type II secretion system protein F [bacterium BMS3Bbin06]HDH01332.1 type II secretion system protein GspF [Nitrospirota bacterium]HDO34905.1 type II secretion system protein GspF [Nitrospirota bacterium]HDY71015.1 type II secretion system protein GspF [Nitrospirota bacterium]
MPIFSYKATSFDGAIHEGVIEAPDEKSAIESIKDSGFIPIKVARPGTKSRLFDIRGWRKADILTFTTELSALLGAGLPLDRSLNILSEITDQKQMKGVIKAILKSISEGSSFSEALSMHPKTFPKLYINMAKAGEAGGVLDVVLDKLVEFLETSKELSEHLSSAMIYPAILTLTGGASIIILLTYVIPKFSKIFTDLGQTLPLPTQILMSLSTFMSNYWWIIISVFIGSWVMLRRYISRPEGKKRWDEFKIKLFRDIVVKLETARFCRTLGTLLRSGVPLLQALSNVKDVIGNTVFASAIEKVIKGAREGKGVSAPIEKTGVFPSLALSMIKVGEETGQLDSMLLKVADTYEKGLRTTVRRFISLLEPMMILIMGLVIGFIVVSILMAIFSINELPM